MLHRCTDSSAFISRYTHIHTNARTHTPTMTTSQGVKQNARTQKRHLRRALIVAVTSSSVYKWTIWIHSLKRDRDHWMVFVEESEAHDRSKSKEFPWPSGGTWTTPRKPESIAYSFEMVFEPATAMADRELPLPRWVLMLPLLDRECPVNRVVKIFSRALLWRALRDELTPAKECSQTGPVVTPPPLLQPVVA